MWELFRPDDFEESVRNDEHLSRHLALATDEVARREDEGFHLEDKVVQELGFAFLEDGHLKLNPANAVATQRNSQ